MQQGIGVAMLEPKTNREVLVSEIARHMSKGRFTMPLFEPGEEPIDISDDTGPVDAADRLTDLIDSVKQFADECPDSKR